MKNDFFLDSFHSPMSVKGAFAKIVKVSCLGVALYGSSIVWESRYLGTEICRSCSEWELRGLQCGGVVVGGSCSVWRLQCSGCNVGRLRCGGVAVGGNKVWGSCSMEEQCYGKWRSCSVGSFGVGRCVLGEFQ